MSPYSSHTSLFELYAGHIGPKIKHSKAFSADTECKNVIERVLAVSRTELKDERAKKQ